MTFVNGPTQREFHTKQYDAETNAVAVYARSLQRTFPRMGWGRAIQIAEREIADRHVDLSTCQSCGGAAVELHTCPYASEIGGDDTALCNCCDSCTQQCAMDI